MKNRASDGYSWYCPYRTKGVGKTRVVAISGGDSLQALILALAALSMTITRWNERQKALSWNGDPEWLGLQVHAVLGAEARQIALGRKRVAGRLR